MDPIFLVFALLFFPGLIAFAGAMDLFTMTIPNRISICLVAGFLIYAPMTGLSLYDIGLHIACGILILALTVGMFELGWMGGGDAKILSAISLWFGFTHLGSFLMLVCILGGLLTLALLMFRKFPLPGAWVRQAWLNRLHHPKTGIPYGISIAAGALIVYPSTQWVLGPIA
ncbi:MAG: prepilin peptidase [Pseudomonadota bacterium]